MSDDKKILKMLSPKVDVVFKLLFGDTRNIDILIDFLKSVLDLSYEEYEKVSILDPHLKRENIDDKLSILDVKATTKSGKIVHIEIQIVEQEEMPERATYYNAKALATQIHSGQDYGTLEKTIGIIITDFNIIKNSNKYHHIFQLYDKPTGIRFTDPIEINTLELNKIPEQSDSTKKYDWLQFLKAESEEEFEMIAEKNPVIEKAVVELKRLSEDESMQMLAEAREKARRDEVSRMKFAVNKGKLEGKLEVAKNFLRLGIPIEQISEGTGLSIEEINKLKG